MNLNELRLRALTAIMMRGQPVSWGEGTQLIREVRGNDGWSMSMPSLISDKYLERAPCLRASTYKQLWQLSDLGKRYILEQEI